jgi:hypothetical protein
VAQNQRAEKLAPATSKGAAFIDVLKPRGATATAADGFVPLFNGKDLTGWHVESGDARQWAVEGDAIVGRSADYRTRNYLLSNREYADFTLRLEFMVDPGSSGGIALRAFEEEKLPYRNGFVPEHPLIKLTDTVKWPNDVPGSAHWVKDDRWGTKPTENPPLSAGAWHTIEVTMHGNSCIAVITGKRVVDLRSEPKNTGVIIPGLKRAKGKIGFQVHTGTVRYRRVQIQELPPPTAVPSPKSAPALGENGFVPLFNGKDLTGWKTHPRQPGGWTVQEGYLVGRSATANHLFSDCGDYEEFHLRAEACTNKFGNSGIYFRSNFAVDRRGRFPTGYVAQILHSFPRPNAALTGSLYGFSNILKPLVEPDEWFTLEILARGNRIVIKVNGQITVDFVDKDSTYRKGHLALKAMSDEGVNQTTVVQFRKIEIKELP